MEKLRPESIRLHLVRHAEVEAAYHRVFGGKIDMNLSPAGHEQAEALAKYLARCEIETIYASPMKRVRQTLIPVIAGLGLQPEICQELREVDFGDWSGLSWEQVQERHGMSAFEWLHHLEQAAIPNGETGRDFRARVEPCLRRILAVSAGKSIAVVCHGGVIRMILSILLEMPLPKMSLFEIDYASSTEIHIHPRRTEVQTLNLAPWRHLV